MSYSVVPNAGGADEHHRQELGRRSGFHMRQSAATDAESADGLHRDLADVVDAVRVDAPCAAHAVALPKREPGRTDGHQRVRTGALDDFPSEPEPEHTLTLRHLAQPQRAAGNEDKAIRTRSGGNASNAKFIVDVYHNALLGTL